MDLKKLFRMFTVSELKSALYVDMNEHNIDTISINTKEKTTNLPEGAKIVSTRMEGTTLVIKFNVVYDNTTGEIKLYSEDSNNSEKFVTEKNAIEKVSVGDIIKFREDSGIHYAIVDSVESASLFGRVLEEKGYVRKVEVTANEFVEKIPVNFPVYAVRYETERQVLYLYASMDCVAPSKFFARGCGFDFGEIDEVMDISGTVRLKEKNIYSITLLSKDFELYYKQNREQKIKGKDISLLPIPGCDVDFACHCLKNTEITPLNSCSIYLLIMRGNKFIGYVGVNKEGYIKVVDLIKEYNEGKIRKEVIRSLLGVFNNRLNGVVMCGYSNTIAFLYSVGATFIDDMRAKKALNDWVTNGVSYDDDLYYFITEYDFYNAIGEPISSKTENSVNDNTDDKGNLLQEVSVGDIVLCKADIAGEVEHRFLVKGINMNANGLYFIGEDLSVNSEYDILEVKTVDRNNFISKVEKSGDSKFKDIKRDDVIRYRNSRMAIVIAVNSNYLDCKQITNDGYFGNAIKVSADEFEGKVDVSYPIYHVKIGGRYYYVSLDAITASRVYANTVGLSMGELGMVEDVTGCINVNLMDVSDIYRDTIDMPVYYKQNSVLFDTSDDISLFSIGGCDEQFVDFCCASEIGVTKICGNCAVYLLIIKDKHPIGYVAITKGGIVSFMEIFKDYQRQGIGTKVIEKLLSVFDGLIYGNVYRDYVSQILFLDAVGANFSSKVADYVIKSTFEGNEINEDKFEPCMYSITECNFDKAIGEGKGGKLKHLKALKTEEVNEAKVVALVYNGIVKGYRFNTNLGVFDIDATVATQLCQGSFYVTKKIDLYNKNGVLVSMQEIKTRVLVPNISDDLYLCTRVIDSLFREKKSAMPDLDIHLD